MKTTQKMSKLKIERKARNLRLTNQRRSEKGQTLNC